MNVLSDFIGRVERNCEKITDDAAVIHLPDPAGLLKKKAAKSAPKEKKPTAKSNVNFDRIFKLSKKELKTVVSEINTKTLAYSLADKAEEQLEQLRKNLPAAYRDELVRIMKELGKPRKATIETYRNKVNEVLKSLI